MSGAAVYPGSFDPVTLGHKDIMERGLGLFDKVIVAVARHASKQALLSETERCALIEATGASIPGSEGRLEAVVFEGLIVDFAKGRGACILRGLRGTGDYEYEAGMAAMNRAMRREVETVFLSASGVYGGISSTLVRQIARMGGDVRPFVPPVVAERLEALGKKGKRE